MATYCAIAPPWDAPTTWAWSMPRHSASQRHLRQKVISKLPSLHRFRCKNRSNAAMTVTGWAKAVNSTNRQKPNKNVYALFILTKAEPPAADGEQADTQAR